MDFVLNNSLSNPENETSVLLIYFWSQFMDSGGWGRCSWSTCIEKWRSKSMQRKRKGKRRLGLFLMVLQLPHDATLKFVILNYMRHSCNIKIFSCTHLRLKLVCVVFYFWVDCWSGKTLLQQRDSSIPNGFICTRMSLTLFSVAPALLF